VKGDLPAEVAVVGGSSGASCGIAFAADTRYLVFASLEGNNLATTLCSGNVELQGAEVGPLATRAPESAETGAELPHAPIILGGIMLLMIGVSLVAFRRSAR
jgi:hypothetical protein